jgi:hypothetical protein
MSLKHTKISSSKLVVINGMQIAKGDITTHPLDLLKLKSDNANYILQGFRKILIS